MAIQTVAALVAELDQSRVLPATQLDEVVRRLQPAYADPRDLARELLKRGWLTPFHVNQIFQGRGLDLVLGQYVLLERIGEGGMGQVYKARHQGLNRFVALKVIRKEWLNNPEALRRFDREIKAAAKLHHPNIVVAFDAAQVGDTHFIAMEYVEGVDLAKMVKQMGPLPIPQACDYIRQAALGLQHAFECGMVHRDIKPSNLLVTRVASGAAGLLGHWGTVKILDMGLARIPKPADGPQDATLTQAGAVVGTPDYIAPEQARDSHGVDYRADIYSLGCTFFNLLTAKVPFPGGTGMEKLFKHQLDAPPRIEQLRTDLPPALAKVVHKLMAKRPEDRYQQPAEIARALAPFIPPDSDSSMTPLPSRLAGRAVAPDREITEFLAPAASQQQRATQASRAEITPADGRHAPAAPPSSRKLAPAAPTLLSEPTRRRSRRWLAPILAVGILASVLGFVAFLSQRDGKPIAVAPTAPTGPGATKPAPDPTRTPLEQLDARGIPAVERIPDLPAEVVAVLGEHRLRNWGMVQFAAFSPTSSLLATLGADRNVRVWDTTTGQLKSVLTSETNTGFAVALAFTADGRVLALYRPMQGAAAGSLLTWQAATGKPSPSPTLPAGHDFVQLAPDGKTAVVVDLAPAGERPRQYFLWDLAENRSRAVLALLDGSMLHYSANGQWLVMITRVMGTNSLLSFWDVAAAKPIRKVTLDQPVYTGVAIHPAGQSFAFSNAKQLECWTLSADKSERLWSTPATGVIVRSPAFTADGKTLLASQYVGLGTSYTEELGSWDAATGKEQAVIPKAAASVAVIAPSPDGQLLALINYGPRVILWDVAAGKERFPMTIGHKGSILGIAFAKNPRRLVSAGGLGTDYNVKLWDLASGKEERTFPEAPLSGPALSLASDGRIVLQRTADAILARDLDTGAEVGRIAGLRFTMVQATFSPNGKLVALYGGADTNLRLYELPALKPRATLSAPAGIPFFSVAFSGDGQTMATGDHRGGIHLWDTASGTERKLAQPLALPKANFTHVALSRDGRALAAISDVGIKAWNLETGAERLDAAFPTKNPRFLFFLQFTPQGDTLIASNMNQVRVYNLTTLQERTLYKGATDQENVSCLTLAPDGKTLAAVDPGHRLLTWDLATGKQTRRIALPGPINQLGFAPDGKHLATGNLNGTVYILRLPTPVNP